MKWYSVKQYQIPVNLSYVFVAISFDNMCLYKLAQYKHNSKTDEFDWFDEKGNTLSQVTHFCIPQPVPIDDIQEEYKYKSEDISIDESIDELDLEARPNRVLKAYGINTIKDLINKTRTQLLCLPNFGRASIIQVERELNFINLRLMDSKNA